MLFPLSVVASDDGQNEELTIADIRDNGRPWHSEIPIDINKSNGKMRILVNDEVDCASLYIYGANASIVYDIKGATPGNIYEYDVSSYPCGQYYITIYIDGETYNGYIQF